MKASWEEVSIRVIGDVYNGWSFLKGNGCGLRLEGQMVEFERDIGEVKTKFTCMKTEEMKGGREDRDDGLCHDGKGRWGFDSRELCWRKEPEQQVLSMP